jgi:hypothetical protein
MDSPLTILLFRITFSTPMNDQDVVFGINAMCKTNSLDKKPMVFTRFSLTV